MNVIMTHIEHWLAKACAVLMAVMVLDVTWQVFSRFILSNPSSITEELARFLLIWIGLLGSAYAYRKYAHLGLDIATAKLEGLRKLWAERIADVICFAFAAVIMVYGGAKIVALTLRLNQSSAALEVPMGYVYCVIPLSGILICLFALERIIHGRPERDDSMNVD